MHFFAIAAMLFWFLSFASPAKNEKQILVTQDNLLNYMQYSAKAFEPDIALSLLNDMSVEERTRLIDAYVRQEALYREALSLGLDREDYVIRTRMVQKMEFLADTSTNIKPIEAPELMAYYEEHKSEYTKTASVTFTHVFISTKHKSNLQAKREAEKLLQQFRQTKIGFNNAVQYGDRFLYHTNYVDQNYDLIKSHFGPNVTKEIFSKKAPLSEWWGPVATDYGAHLVFITQRKPSRLPLLGEIQARVENDFAVQRRRERITVLTEKIISQYTPVISPDMQTK